MPNNVQRNLIQDGDRHAIMHVIVESDGSGDLNREVIVDVSTDFTKSFSGSGFLLGIDQLWFDQTSNFGISFTGMLYFQSQGVDQPDQLIWPLSPSPGDTHLDWRDFGGIKDRLGIDSQGKIILSTIGFVDPQSKFGLILAMKKYNRPLSDFPIGTLTTAPSISNSTPSFALSGNVSGNRDQ